MISTDKKVKRQIHELASLGAELVSLVRYKITPDAASNTALKTATSLVLTEMTGFTQPDVTRALTVTATGGSVHGDVHILGRDIFGDTIAETIAVITANTQTTTKAFRSIDQVRFAGGTSGSVALGVADKFGLPSLLDTSSVLYLDTGSARDTYTVVVDEDEICKNLITPGTSADGSLTFETVYVPK